MIASPGRRVPLFLSTGIGIAMGLVLFGLKIWLLGLGYIFGVFFWIVTGRFVGAGLGARINQPVS